MVVGLVGDVVNERVDVGWADGECAVAGLPVEVGELWILAMDPVC